MSSDGKPWWATTEWHTAKDLLGTPEAIENAINFVCGNSLGVGDNRRRALLCRGLKHVVLNPVQREELLHHILQRLREGIIYEQSIDRFRLVRHLDPQAAHECAESLLKADKVYMRRFAARALRYWPSGLALP